MRTAFIVLVGAASLTLLGCGAQTGNTEGDPPEEAPGVEEVGVSTSELTACTRTELANREVAFMGSNFLCYYRLMENNFVCAEGVVGQASTEVLSGQGDTFTYVETRLFDQNHTGDNGWASPATIATQWGHTYGSSHLVRCKDDNGVWHSASWNMDPFSKRAVPGKWRTE